MRAATHWGPHTLLNSVGPLGSTEFTDLEIMHQKTKEPAHSALCTFLLFTQMCLEMEFKTMSPVINYYEEIHNSAAFRK